MKTNCAACFSDEKVKRTTVFEKYKNSRQTINLKTDTLDSIIQDNLDLRISFLKADVEGYERELLAGAMDTIRRDKPSLSICTYHLPDDPIIIPRLIQSTGIKYRLWFSQGLGVLHGIPLEE